MIFYVVSTLGMYALLAFGSYCIIRRIFYSIAPFPIDPYTDFFFKTVFIVEVFLFVFCRSRVTLRFFPILSLIISHVFMIIMALNIYKNVMILLNLYFTLQLILFTVFLLIEQAIQNEGEKGLTG